jgi:hypothetical protein
VASAKTLEDGLGCEPLAHEAADQARGGGAVEGAGVLALEAFRDRPIEEGGLVDVREDAVHGRVCDFGVDAERADLLEHAAAPAQANRPLEPGGCRRCPPVVQRAVPLQPCHDVVDIVGCKTASKKPGAEGRRRDLAARQQCQRRSVAARRR